MFVDGYCEASAKNVENNKLDGLSIGCDHNGVFFSRRHRQLRLPTATSRRRNACRWKPPSPAATASYSCAPTLPTAPARAGRASFSCAPRAAAAAAAAAARTAEY